MLDPQITISVVTPTRGDNLLLRRAIQSVCSQTLPPSELIIVVDGNNYAPVESYLADAGLNKTSIRVISTGKKRGANACRNLGVAIANSSYIAFLDDDDSFDGDYLEKMSSEVASGFDLYYASKALCYESNLHRTVREVLAARDIDFDDLLFGNAIGTTSSVMLSKEVFLRVGGFDEELCAYQDYDLWLRFLYISRARSAKNAMVRYTIPYARQSIGGNTDVASGAAKRILEKWRHRLGGEAFQTLEASLSFSIAKTLHRKNYIRSIPYTLRAIVLHRRLKGVALLLPSWVLRIISRSTT